jgi:asparagine synthase (glutamine-hydrolysing)
LSGIAGIIRFDGGPVDPARLHRMTDAMAHRGPDGIAHWVEGSVGLGHCMLRTTPEALEETQPLTNEDESLVLVWDGYLTNDDELRRDLLGRGTRLRSRSDAELVLRAYETWGRECPTYLEGDFAFAIWDQRRRELFCGRDRIGNKLVTYGWVGSTFVFATEVGATIHGLGALPEFNLGMVAEFLAGEWYSHEETFWKGLLRLEAAHTLHVAASGSRVARYWRPDFSHRLNFRRDEEYVDLYRHLLEQSVKRAARTNGPLACEASGGLDSSALFAIAADLQRRAELPAPGLNAYTLDYRGVGEADESEYYRSVEEHVGIPVTPVKPTEPPPSWYAERAARNREFPAYPNGVMGLGIREQARADGSRALMVGIGGDEWLVGGRSYYAEAIRAVDPRQFLRSLAHDARSCGLGTALWWSLSYSCAGFLPWKVKQRLGRMRARPSDGWIDRREWLMPELRRLLVERADAHDARSNDAPWPGQRNKLATLESAFSAHARELEDRLAADAGIELRYPFHSESLVAFSFATPEHMRLRGKTTKYLHRRAMVGVLPPKVVARATKASFMCSFRTSLDTLTEGLEAPAGWVDAASIPKIATLVGRDQGNWAEFMLWTLHGCRHVPSRPGCTPAPPVELARPSRDLRKALEIETAADRV